MLKRESIRDWMKPQIAHSLPGRLRLVVSGLEFIQGERQDLAWDLAGIPGVYRVRITVPTSGVLLEYNPGRMDASVMLEQANMVIQKYAMAVYRSRHTGRTEESAELSMPVRTLGKRLAVNVGALALGNFVFKAAPATGLLGKLTSVQALTSLGLSLPIAKSAMNGIRKDMRPNADFLTVTSIVASLLLGNANSALMILALSDLAEMMTAYTIEKTRSSIKKMLSVEDGNIWKVNSDGSLTRCSIAQARPGDLIEVHTGEKILVDGIVSSAAMARARAVFSSMRSVSICMETTRGFPSVIVPVLSSRTVLASLICSIYAPPLIRIPCFTAELIAAENAVAVESLIPHE